MKVRVSIPGAYTAVELEEDQAQKAFWKLSETLGVFSRMKVICRGSKIPADNAGEVKPNPEVTVPESPAADPEEVREVESLDPVLDAEESDESEEPDTEESSLPAEPKFKYKGFLYIKCPKCGAVKGFTARKPTDHYHCDCCGARSEFDGPLVPLWVNCECGRSFHYFTNMEEPAFDINCLECGMPVAVEWNSKKHMYVTIREKG